MSEIKKYNADKYTWQAVYNDGTSLWECGPSLETKLCLSVGLVNASTNRGIVEYKGQNLCSNDVGADHGHPIIAKYDQIDRDKITKFNVYETAKLGAQDLKPVISLDIKSGYRLIWRKRRHQRLIGTQVPFKTVYLVGWQATIRPLCKGGGGISNGGQNVQSIIYLYEDGKMEMSSRKSDYELFNFETETP